MCRLNPCQAVYNREDCANKIQSSYTVLNEAIHNFQSDVEEISFFVAEGALVPLTTSTHLLQRPSKFPTTLRSMVGATPGACYHSLYGS